MNNDSKIIVFGTGELANRWLQKLETFGSINCFVDNDERKIGTQFHGKPVYAPQTLLSQDYDRLYIASSYSDEILTQLAKRNQIDHRVYLVDGNTGPVLEPALSQLVGLPEIAPKLLLEYLAGIKASNRFLALREAREQVVDVSTLPSELVIDPINLCNLSCPLCPTGKRAQGVQKGQIKASDYRRLLEDIGESLCIIYLQNWGEPTLHKELGELIKISDEKKAVTYLASNLNILNAQTAEAILTSGLKFLKVEVDGASQESYQKFRKGGKLSKVLENMQRLAERKRELGLEYPTINAACLVSSYNENELEQVTRIAKEHGADQVGFYRISLDSRREDLVQEWNPSTHQYQLNIQDPNSRNFCSDPWKMVAVNFDGATQPCCRIFDDRVTFGNLLNTPIRELWTNDHFRSARQALASGDKTAGNTKTICHSCMGNLNSDELEQVEGTFAIRLPRSKRERQA